jgi:hypothetical protein
MKYALIVSMGLCAASCNAADNAWSLDGKLETVSTFVKSGYCDEAASLYDREIAPTDLASSTKLKLLTMIAGKYFENDRDHEGRKYAAQAAELYTEQPLKKAVIIAASSALRIFDMQEKWADERVGKK